MISFFEGDFNEKITGYFIMHFPDCRYCFVRRNKKRRSRQKTRTEINAYNSAVPSSDSDSDTCDGEADTD